MNKGLTIAEFAERVGNVAMQYDCKGSHMQAKMVGAEIDAILRGLPEDLTKGYASK